MPLILNEEEQMLKDAAAGFLAEKAPVAALRQLRDERSEAGYDKALWQEMAEMGWTGIAIPEAYGGLGYGYVGLGLVLEQMGRNLSVSPLQSAIATAASLINIAASEEQKQALLPDIAAGTLLVTLALQEGRHHAPANTALTATCKDGNYILNGKKVAVIDAHVADKIIVVARTSGSAGDDQGLSLFLLDSNCAGLSCERVIMVDSRNAGNIVLDNVTVSSADLVGELDGAIDALEQTLSIANTCLAAEMLGLSLQAYETTVEYLKQRSQFDAVLGSFQGLQHRAADMFAELELCKSMVLATLQAIDASAQDVHILAAGTKAKLCEVTERVTNEAIQMHGGIGMTDEFDMGFYLKRSRVAQQTLGGYSYQLDRFASLNGF
ncbi:MAG: alkylation response protein AidB-like acyl-CoA dehydrogenase [Paraglaciecola psychrophila]|jgi:alkylation response protein AidB-like acyl-CoA dehydrogenase